MRLMGHVACMRRDMD